MIEIQNLSLDDEANMYISTYFHKLEVSEVKILPPDEEKMKRSKSNQSISSNVLCYRCGNSGHISANCFDELPSLKELEDEMNKDISEAIEELKASNLYKEDEVGLYIENSNSINVNSNFSNSQICLNCGEVGHLIRQCPKPSMDQIIDEIGIYIIPHSNQPNDKIEEMFNRIWNQ